MQRTKHEIEDMLFSALNPVILLHMVNHPFFRTETGMVYFPAPNNWQKTTGVLREIGHAGLTGTMYSDKRSMVCSLLYSYYIILLLLVFHTTDS